MACDVAPVLNHMNYSQPYSKVAAEEIALFHTSVLCTQPPSYAPKDERTALKPQRQKQEVNSWHQYSKYGNWRMRHLLSPYFKNDKKCTWRLPRTMTLQKEFKPMNTYWRYASQSYVSLTWVIQAQFLLLELDCNNHLLGNFMLPITGAEGFLCNKLHKR